MSDDAVSRDPAASYALAESAPAVDDAVQQSVVEEQLGRPSRGRSAVVHRCVFGLPTVLRVDPRLDDGTPFPTTFWLACPALNSAIGTLEAEQGIAEANALLADDETAAADYLAAQQRLVDFRDRLGGGEKLPGDPTAGGRPGHVKCLHTAVGHHLGTGDNVVGAWALDRVTPLACPGPCAGPDRLTSPS